MESRVATVPVCLKIGELLLSLLQTGCLLEIAGRTLIIMHILEILRAHRLLTDQRRRSSFPMRSVPFQLRYRDIS
jgi:hypothetical protein